MKKALTKRQWIRKVDKVFSEYIRLRDADDLGYCHCITCGKVYPWKQIHNGHFISRSEEATRYNEINCNSQCVSCNSIKQGQPHIYRRKLIEKYGKEAIEALEEIARIGGKFDIYQLQEMYNEYREKVKALKKEKGIR